MMFLIALLVGAVSAFAFQPYALWPLMPLAFAALCELVARAPTLRRALLVGWGFAVGQFVVGLNWIATAFTFQAAMPAWLGWIAVVLLSFYLAVFMMLATGLAWKFGRERRLALVLALAGAWALCEYLRGTMFTGFAWNPVGVVWSIRRLRGASRLIGTYGLSALTVLAGGVIWLAFRGGWRSALPPLAIIVAAAFASTTVGKSDVRTGRKIRIVQPNIPQEDKWREGLGDEAFLRLGGLSRGGNRRTAPAVLARSRGARAVPGPRRRPAAARAPTARHPARGAVAAPGRPAADRRLRAQGRPRRDDRREYQQRLRA